EERREAVFPAEPLEARGERRGVADHDDDLHPEAPREPLRREKRDRILDERPPGATPRLSQARVVVRNPGDVTPRSRPTQLRPEVVAQAERPLEPGPVAGLVLRGDHREVAVEP